MEWMILLGFAWLVLSLGLFASQCRQRDVGVSGVYQVPILNEEDAGHVGAGSTKGFLRRLFILAFLTRLALVIFFKLTDAIFLLRLSPDSERYHREGIVIAQEMQNGFFNWPNWIDNGWFQFTGLIYYLFGPNALLLQLFNVLLGASTPVVIYLLVKKAFHNEQTARWTAILTAFFPSFIYWSSLMLKDPLSILAITLIVLAVVSIRERFEVRWLVIMALGLVFYLGVREYMFFMCLFFIVLSYFPVEGRNTGFLLVKLALITLLVGAGAYGMGFGFLGMDYIAQSQYFDLDYINQSRINIGDHGSGAFFDDPSSALWGKDLAGTLKALAAAIYFSFISLDLMDIGSTRQLMALPETLVVVMLLPHFFRGVAGSWRHHRQSTLPLMIFAFGLLAVVGSATTNMGAMFRWRMQALPFLLAFLVYGLTLHGRGWFYRLLSRLRI